MLEESKAPYPIPKVTQKNLEYAQILLQDYAGEVSEQTAIHLYSYQSFLPEEIWKTYARAIEKIAETEMKHFSLLGRTIALLGIDPIYATISCENNGLQYWNSNYVDYTTDPKKMLEVDIASEKAAILNYQKHIEIIHDPYIEQMLERIIEDEKIHLKKFESMLEQIKKLTK